MDYSVHSPSPLFIARGCVILFTVLAIGLIFLLKSPWLWVVVAGFYLIAQTIKTVYEIFMDMKRERDRAKAMLRKERARACKAMKVMKSKLVKMERRNEFLMWQLQQNMVAANAPKTFILQYINNIDLNGMIILGNVDMNGGNIYSDNAAHNETHYHYGNEYKMEANNKMAGGAFPALSLLDDLMQVAITQHPNSPKHLLMPVRAGKEAEVLPMVDLKWMNDRYRLTLSGQNWSDWVNKKDANYDAKELAPLVTRFQALQTPENGDARLQSPL